MIKDGLIIREHSYGNQIASNTLWRRSFAMMIYMLATAMTVAMLIATAFGLHQETERLRLKQKRSTLRGFGPR